MNIKSLLKQLTNEQLSELYSLIYDIKTERTIIKINSGEFPKLTEEEKSQKKIEAIKSYKERTGCSITEAKLVVENETQKEWMNPGVYVGNMNREK
jgi:ribosomal protein L7/L12